MPNPDYYPDSDVCESVTVQLLCAIDPLDDPKPGQRVWADGLVGDVLPCPVCKTDKVVLRWGAGRTSIHGHWKWIDFVLECGHTVAR